MHKRERHCCRTSSIVVSFHCARLISASTCFTRNPLSYYPFYHITPLPYLVLALISSRSYNLLCISSSNIRDILFINYPHHSPITMTCFSCRLGPRCLTRDLRELGFKKKLVRKFVECPDSVKHATALLKSYSPPSRKPRKGRYNDLCLRKGSRKQRKSTRARMTACRPY